MEKDIDYYRKLVNSPEMIADAISGLAYNLTKDYPDTKLKISKGKCYGLDCMKCSKRIHGCSNKPEK